MGETHIAGYDHARSRFCREMAALEERSGKTKPVLRAPPGKYCVTPVIEWRDRHVKVTVSKSLNKTLGAASREQKQRKKKSSCGRKQTVKLSRQVDNEHNAYVHSVALNALDYDQLHALTLNYPRGFTGEQIRKVCTRLTRSLSDKFGNALAGWLRREWSGSAFAIFHEHGVAYFPDGTPKGFAKFLQKSFRGHVRNAGGEATADAVLIEPLASPEDMRKWCGYAWKTADGADKKRLRDIAYLPDGGNWIHHFRGEMPLGEPGRKGKLTAAQLLMFLAEACARTGAELLDLRNKIFSMEREETKELLARIENLPDDAVPWPLPEGMPRTEFDAFLVVGEDGFPSAIEIYYGDYMSAKPVVVEMDVLRKWIRDLRGQILAERENISCGDSVVDIPEEAASRTEDGENIASPRRSDSSPEHNPGPVLISVLLLVLQLTGHAVLMCLRAMTLCVQELCAWEASRSPSRPEG